LSATQYWSFKHKPDSEATVEEILKYVHIAQEKKCTLMQYEYGLQNNGVVTHNWNNAKKIKEGDYLFLRGDDKVYAVGRVIRPRLSPDITLNMEEIIKKKDHGQYRSDKYNKCIHFNDSNVFYEDLSDGEREWGQRVDVDSWDNFNDDGIDAKKEKLYKPDFITYSVIRELKEDAAKNLMRQLRGETMEKEIYFDERYMELLKQNRNIILTGAPGTGKTYKTVEFAVFICDGSIPNNRSDLMKRYKELMEKEKQISFTTFHQSLDYEEFIEGLKPDIDETTEQGTGSYSVKAGIFKEICNRAKEKSSMTALDEAIEKLKSECSDEIIKVKSKTGIEFSVIYRDGRTFRVRSDKSESDEGKDTPANIEMIKNLYKGNRQGIYNETYVWGILNYLKTTYKIDEYKEDSSDKNYVLIIDEINRGNISKIFGELITLLENDKRLGRENETTAVLPYSQKSFGVPSNLFIIGTMNTADRSIGHIDYAIRRRFAFIPIIASRDVIADHSNYENEETKQVALVLFDTIKDFIKDNINSDLEADDLMIGHSYFLCKTKLELEQRLEYEIIPLIGEYEKDGIIMFGKRELKGKFEEWNNLILLNTKLFLIKIMK